MWADSLLVAERAQLVRLLLWGACSVLAGTALFGAIAARRLSSPLLRHFALQMAAWGVIVLGASAIGWRSLALRDVHGAARLEQATWFAAGLTTCAVCAGFALVLAGWSWRGATTPARHTLLGAGLGVMTQGAGLLALTLHFIAVYGRLTLRFNG